MPNSEPSLRAARRRSRLLLASSVAVGALIVTVGLVSLVVGRAAGPFAVSMLTNWLAEHGAPSRIELRSFDTQGLSARLVLGDPQDPELTVERLDVTYTLTGPWSGMALAITPRTLRLVRPRLRIGLVNGRPDFGRLEGLAAWARRQPPSKTPLPDIEVDGAELRLMTPRGVVTMTGGGRLRGGRLELAEGQLSPATHVGIGGTEVTTGGGAFRLEGRGRQLLAHLKLGPSRVDAGSVSSPASVAITGLRLEGSAPYPERLDRVTGALHLTLSVRDLQAVSRGRRAGVSQVEANLAGALDAAKDGQTFTGALQGDGAGISGVVGDESLDGAAARFTLTDIALIHDIKGVSAQAHGRLSARSGRVQSPRGMLTDLAADLALVDGRLSGQGARMDGVARLSGRFRGHGAASPRGVRALVAAIPEAGGERPYGAALAQALANFDVAAPTLRLNLGRNGGYLALGAPLTITAASGARLTLTGSAAAQGGRITGAAGVTLLGGGAPSLDLAFDDAVATSRGLNARFSGRLGVDTAALRGVALSARGALAKSGRELRVSLEGCAPIEVARLDLPSTPVRDISLRLCAGASPLVRLARDGWRAQGRLEAVGAAAPGLDLALRRADLDFDAAGDRMGLSSAHLSVLRMDVSDTAAALRFTPTTFTGRAYLIRGQWRGTFEARGAAGRAAANITLVDDMTQGDGRLDLAAPELVFASGGLQPADLSPLAAPVRSVDGRTAFSGWVAWDGHGVLTSGGRLTARASRLTGPMGVMRDVAADIQLTSLLPPTTAPGQTISVGLIEAVTPVTDIQGRFQLDADALRVERLDAGFAKGRVSLEPFRASFSPNANVSSAVVLRGVDLGEIIAATNVADTVKLEARIDGRIPFTAGPAGLVVQHGSLAAEAPGRLTISRKAFQSPGAQANFAQDFAYQAMEDLAFDSLDATVVSLPHDRLGMIFHIKGRHDPAAPQRALVRMSDALRGQMFARPLPLPSGTNIDMTLDTSLNFGELVTALEASWRDALAVRGAQESRHATTGADPGARLKPETEHP